MKNFREKSSAGFTLFVAIVVMGTLLLISMGMINLAVRQAVLSSASKESQHAFYAADTGAECAIFWDVKNSTGFTAFSTSTPTNIECNRDALNGSNFWSVGGGFVSTFTLTMLPDPYCAVITVTKELDGTTRIESLGYNTCDSSNLRRVERAVRVTY